MNYVNGTSQKWTFTQWSEIGEKNENAQEKSKRDWRRPPHGIIEVSTFIFIYSVIISRQLKKQELIKSFQYASIPHMKLPLLICNTYSINKQFSS